MLINYHRFVSLVKIKKKEVLLLTVNTSLSDFDTDNIFLNTANSTQVKTGVNYIRIDAVLQQQTLLNIKLHFL